jgi:hypothetical protein
LASFASLRSSDSRCWTWAFQAVVLRHEEYRPIPEVLLAIVLIESILDGIALADIDRGQNAVVRLADQDINAGLLELATPDDFLLVLNQASPQAF